MSTSFTLVSHHLCPYVQRVAIALAEKNIDFERVYVDLGNKPDWFRAISPLGKVPLLKVSDETTEHVLFESIAVLEYLEDTLSHPLHPGDLIRRAEHRGWMEIGSSILDDIAGFYSAVNQQAFSNRISSLRGKFARLEQRLKFQPYFDGTEFSLVDTVFGPVFRYFDVFDRIGDFGIFRATPGVIAWRHALTHRPSIRAAVSYDYEYRLWQFLKARKSYLAAQITSQSK